MKKITISVDAKTHRAARVVAAKRDTSVAALVRGYLHTLIDQDTWIYGVEQVQEYMIDTIREKHPEFSCSENLSRKEIYEKSW